VIAIGNIRTAAGKPNEGPSVEQRKENQKDQIEPNADAFVPKQEVPEPREND
jgi:hypothetical protein